MKKGFQAAALFFTLGAASAAQAALVTFEVDPTRSVISLGAIKLNNGDVTLAQPGGDSANYSGTLEADIVGNTITFLGGAQNIVADNSAGPLLPGAAPGNYGIVNIEGDTAAFREFKFAFEKMFDPFDIAPDGTLLRQGTPDLGVPDLAASWTRSTNAGSFFTDRTLTNFGPSTPAKLTESGGITTLEIPVVTFITWDGSASEIQLVGRIVATNGIPEPGSFGLLTLGGSMLLARRRKI